MIKAVPLLESFAEILPTRSDAQVDEVSRTHRSTNTNSRALEGRLQTLPLYILGDFNQTIPQDWQPDSIFQSLNETFAPPLSILTAELTGPYGKLLIDHLAASPNLRFSLKRLLPKDSDAGLRLSDHTGIVAKIL